MNKMVLLGDVFHHHHHVCPQQGRILLFWKSKKILSSLTKHKKWYPSHTHTHTTRIVEVVVVKPSTFHSIHFSQLSIAQYNQPSKLNQKKNNHFPFTKWWSSLYTRSHTYTNTRSGTIHKKKNGNKHHQHSNIKKHTTRVTNAKQHANAIILHTSWKCYMWCAYNFLFLFFHFNPI